MPLTALILLICGVSQMAEPARIDFARGKSTAVVRGSLSGAQQMLYSAVGREKQTVTLILTQSPPHSMQVLLSDADAKSIALQSLTPDQSSATLPKSGVFNILVTRVSKRPGTSRYALRVTIR